MSLTRGRILLVLLLPLSVLPLSSGLRAATYYVDFAAGADAQDGTAPERCWKHAPGDSAATEKPAATKLQPGDTVIFKGGVIYRGHVKAAWSGAEGQPITFDGNSAGTFGANKAILDGSEPLAGWKPCPSAEECGGNPNWKNIFTTLAPAGLTVDDANLYQGEKMLWTAQDPNPKQPIFWDYIEGFHPFPGKQGSQTQVTDPGYFKQTDPKAWDGARIALWMQGNSVCTQKVTGYDPKAGMLTFQKIPNPLYDRGLLTMLNSLVVLDQPGEYVFAPAPGPDGRYRVYLWPLDPKAVEAGEVTYSARPVGFNAAGQSHLALRGLIIQRFCGHFADVPCRGVGVSAESDRAGSEDVLVRDVEIRWCDKHVFATGHQAAIVITNSRKVIVENTIAHDNRRCGGIYLLGATADSVVRNSTFTRNGMQPIWVMGAKNCQVLDNKVLDNIGTHSNGISVYLNSSDILVQNNLVFDSNIAFTCQESANVTLIGNLLHTPGFYALADWGRCKNLKVFHNVILRDENLTAYAAGPESTAEVKNNVITGGRPEGATGWNVDKDHNLRVTKAELGQVFVDAAKRDFRPKPGSPVIDAGVDVGVTKDLAGTPVPQGKAPDIGAYEIRAGGP